MPRLVHEIALALRVSDYAVIALIGSVLMVLAMARPHYSWQGYGLSALIPLVLVWVFIFLVYGATRGRWRRPGFHADVPLYD